jgi:hypothetical protein
MQLQGGKLIFGEVIEAVVWWGKSIIRSGKAMIDERDYR